MGELPKGWETRRARYLFKKEQRATQPGDEIVTAFRDGQVTLRRNRRISGFTEATDYSHYQGIRKGDLVIHQMDAFAGCAGVSDSDGMGTPVLSVCTPLDDGVDVRYFAHVVRLMGRNGFIQSLAKGIRERSADFRFETFAKQELPVPPFAEQQAIVAHIEEETAKIDALVEKLGEEIAKLKEYRERVVAAAVTGERRVVEVEA
jgi:type I restriction enzyme S subunit